MDLNELEKIWWQRLQEARRRYDAAYTASKALVDEHMDGHMDAHLSPECAQAIIHAHKRELKALDEYERVLKTFTDLVARGMVPDEGVS